MSHATQTAPQAMEDSRCDRPRGRTARGRSRRRDRVQRDERPADRDDDLEHRAEVRPDQARVADHPREQVLRRDLHRPQPEQLPLEDAAEPGRAAEELLRHRPLEHGQLPVDGVGPGAGGGHPVRLQRRGHRLRQQLEHHHVSGAEQGPGRLGRERRRSPAAPTRPTAATAAPTRPTRRRCSTSSTRPARPGRATRRTSATSPVARTRVCGGPGIAANNPDDQPDLHERTAAHPLPAGVTSFTGAQANDQYVAKHFPFPWFESLTGTSTRRHAPGLTKPAQGGTDCDANHIANLDSSSQRPVPGPAERVDDAGVQLDHARTTAATPTTRSARATTCPVRSRSTGAADLPDPDAEPRSRPRRRTTPAACTPLTCSSSTTSR